ncbi:hypothetical protein RvVAT039_07560 [Agrobacterium vitis]|uniref:hypothetical protein n=1 Tax=Agrobacterium vitis TaxID=373 RepID=UPI0015DB0A3A|nr:hypothetical protein [Agrobacterium vitis]BCH63540.1 hypothetical protein RvVAT039_07560 [Agrobacterium vitis]
MKSVSHIGRRRDVAPLQARQPSIYHSEVTIKNVGPASFRSEHARDYACLLDVDPNVVEWRVAPPLTRGGLAEYHLDFLVVFESGSYLVDVAYEEPSPPSWVIPAIESMGHRYRPVAMEEVDGCFRLRNAKDLLRYGLYRPPLGDRIRILAAMDEMGSLTIAECLSAVVEGRPMPTVAALVLQGFLEVDLDSDMIRPDTQVRRIRR